MHRAWLTSLAATLIWCCTAGIASAHPYRDVDVEHDFALSVERFMGVDFTDWQSPRRSEVSARLLLNANEPVPTSLGRVGFDYFLSRLSLGVAAGFASDDVFVLAPRIGYMLGLSRTFGLWLRAGMFAAGGGPNYFGFTAEAMFHWWIDSHVSLHFGPTLDIGLAGRRYADYVDLGIPQAGVTVWF